MFNRCCEKAEDYTLDKALGQILDIKLENRKKLSAGQNPGERILLEAF
jgi:hypothetical protein